MSFPESQNVAMGNDRVIADVITVKMRSYLGRVDS